MTLPTLTSIRKRRGALGKTQKQLADLSGLSQSVIAKVEQGRVDPSYTTASRILETLERLESEEFSGYEHLSLTVKNVMTPSVISVSPSDSVAKAQSILTDSKSSISQVPVIDKDKRVVGSLTEAQVLPISKTDRRLVREIMVEPFPMVSQNTSISTVRNILLGEPAVLVSDGKSGIAGIVTKYDLIVAIRA